MNYNINRGGYFNKQKYPKMLACLGFLVGVLIISGISYALWSTTKEQTSINRISSGCLKLEVTEGTNINIENAYQTPDNEGLNQEGYTFTINNNCNYEEYVEVNLDIKNNNTLDAKNIRATLLYNNKKIIEPNNLNNLLDRETTNKEYNKGKHLTTVKIDANKSKQLNLKIWLDENTSFNDLQENNTFESKIEINSIKRENILASDYVRIISEDNEQLAYDETIDNNLRYIGATPNNYVDFNNEKWRIIGVMNNVYNETGKKETRVKLIRAKSLGNFKWDYKQNGIGSSMSKNGSNDWSDSQLMMMLNPEDVVKENWQNTAKSNYEIDSEGYVLDNNKIKIYRGVGSYYNHETGYKPNKVSSTENFVEQEIDFSEIGLKDESKILIDKAIFNLGGVKRTNSNDDNILLNIHEFYDAERNSVVPNNSYPKEWVGYVGLMYPSDFGYATSGSSEKSRNSCLELPLHHGWNNNLECSNNDWLSDNDIQLSITPYAGWLDCVIGISYSGEGLGVQQVYNSHVIKPVVYLKSNTIIKSGTGTEKDPFVLTI